MRFKGSESRKKRKVVAIATLAFLSMINLTVYPSSHSKYIDSGTLNYSATIHPLYKGKMDIALLGKGQDDEFKSTYKYAYFKFSFNQNDALIGNSALTGEIKDTYEILINEPTNGACEINSTGPNGTFDNNNTITYTSAGNSQNDIYLKCNVNELAKNGQINVSVTIKETIEKYDKNGNIEIKKEISKYKDGNFNLSLDKYYEDFPLETKLRWTSTYIELPDTIPDEFFDQLKAGTLPSYLKDWLPENFDTNFEVPESMEEKIYFIFKNVWLKNIVSPTYGEEIVKYVTEKAYTNGSSLFAEDIVNKNNASLKGLSGRKLEEHVWRYDVLNNFIGYARTEVDKDDLVESNNAMYFSDISKNTTDINAIFKYYLDTYKYLNGTGTIEPSTNKDNYNLLMNYIHSFTPNNNGIAYILKNAIVITNPTEGQEEGQLILNGKVVEGLRYYKNDGRLEISSDILSIANGVLNKVIEIPFTSSDVRIDLADGLEKYYNDIFSDTAIEWIRTHYSDMTDSILNHTIDEDYVVYLDPGFDTDKFILFKIQNDINSGKSYVTAKEFDFTYSYDVDIVRKVLSIDEEKDGLKVVQALDKYWSKWYYENLLPIHQNINEVHVSDATYENNKVAYRIPDSMINIPENGDILSVLKEKIPSLANSLTNLSLEKGEVQNFLSSDEGIKYLVVKDNTNNYILLTNHTNVDGSIFITSKTLSLEVSGSKLKFTMRDWNQDRLLDALNALDIYLGVTSYGSPIRDELVNDRFITVTPSGERTKVVYEFDQTQIIIPFDSTNVAEMLKNGLNDHYSDISTSWSGTEFNKVKNIIEKNSGDNYYVWESFSDDNDNTNDFLLFHILADDKSKNNYITVENFSDWKKSSAYIDADEKITLRIKTSFEPLEVVRALDTKYGVPLHNSLDGDELKNHVANVNIEDSIITYMVPTSKVVTAEFSTMSIMLTDIADKVSKTYGFDLSNGLEQASERRNKEVSDFLSETAGTRYLVVQDDNNQYVLLVSHSTANNSPLQITAKLLPSNASLIVLTDLIQSNLLEPIKALDRAFGVTPHDEIVQDAYIRRIDTINDPATGNSVHRVVYQIPTETTNSLNLVEEVIANDEIQKTELLESEEVKKEQNQILDIFLETEVSNEIEVDSMKDETLEVEEKKNVSEVNVEDTLKEKVENNILTSDDESEEIIEDKAIVLDNKTKEVEDKTIVSNDKTEKIEDNSITPDNASSVDTGASLDTADNITPSVTNDVTSESTINISNEVVLESHLQ